MNQLQIGRWQVLPSLNELRSEGAVRRIQPQQMELLMRLVREPGEVIPRESLINEVWTRDEVNDEVLSRAVAELRQALGDDARKPQYIETIPKRGYRLIAVVGPSAGDGGAEISGPAVPTVLRWMLVLVGAAVLLAALVILTLPSTETEPTQVDIATHATVLTGQSGIERAPAVSADGARVAYVRGFISGQVDTGLAWVDVASAAVTEVEVENMQLAYVAWGPQGRRLAVSGLRNDQCVVLVQGLDGQFEEVAACGEGARIDWSGDGQWIYFSPPQSNGAAGLARVRLSDGHLEELTYPAASTQFDAIPRVSPDGTRLAFTRGDLTISEVWVLELGATHGPRPITSDGQLVTGLAWKDDQTLIYSSDRNAIQAIRELDVASGQVRALGAREGRGLHYAAGRLVWERPRYEANIWRIGLEGGQADLPSPGLPSPELWVESNRYDNHPSTSHDDAYISFISNRSDRVALWLADSDANNPRKLLELPETRLSRPSWHPQRHEVLLTVFDQQGTRLMRSGLDGQAQVISHSEGALEGVWLADGETVIAILVRENKPGLWRLAGDSEPERIGTFAPSRVMADGQGGIWFTYVGAPGLFKLDPDTLHPQAVVPTLPQWAWNDWTVRADKLAYANEEGVWLGDLEGNNPRLVSERVPNPVGLTLGLSADGNNLFAAYTDGVEIDLVTAVLEAVGN